MTEPADKSRDVKEESVIVSRRPTPSRPVMPAFYGLDKVKSAPGELLNWEEALRSLAEARLYWIATVRPDGRPHAVPAEGVCIDGFPYFGAAPGTRRARNLSTNPHVVVHTESAEKAVILEGRALGVTDRETLEHLVDVFEAKYGYRSKVEHLVGTRVLVPSVAFSWTEKDFSESATRWVFDRQKPPQDA